MGRYKNQTVFAFQGSLQVFQALHPQPAEQLLSGQSRRLEEFDKGNAQVLKYLSRHGFDLVASPVRMCKLQVSAHNTTVGHIRQISDTAQNLAKRDYIAVRYFADHALWNIIDVIGSLMTHSFAIIRIGYHGSIFPTHAKSGVYSGC